MSKSKKKQKTLISRSKNQKLISKHRKKNQRLMSKSRILLAVFAVLCILASFGIAIYPTVSDYYYSLVHKHTIADYSVQVEKMEDDNIEEIFSGAREYNEYLLNAGKHPSQEPDENEIERYNQLLNIDVGGVMGYIRIPAISVFLPIYHGSDENVLQVGVGHMPLSSFPIGGEGTHCVLTGHSGLPSASLFTNLDQLKEGDIFTITVLKEVLTYEVDQILVVLPNDMGALSIEPGKDYCTLVTCTPYGVNTHRLLVRGHRIETKEEEAKEIKKVASNIKSVPLIDSRINPIIPAVVLITDVFAVCIALVGLKKKKKSSRKKRKSSRRR